MCLLCEMTYQVTWKAVKHISRYLLGSQVKGIILQPKKSMFDCWVNASHAGEWKKNGDEAIHDSTTTKSCTDYVLQYAGCPII
jgi:hypothetical protein